MPVATRGQDAAKLETFGRMAIGSLLAGFDDFSDEQEQFPRGHRGGHQPRGASRTFNAG